MRKNEALKKEYELIHLLQADFSDLDAEIESMELEDIESIGDSLGPILRFESEVGLNNDPVLVSLYFLPIVDDETYELYFTTSIAVTDEIQSDEKKMSMLQAISLLNYCIPYGSFVFDTNIDILSFRQNVPVNENLDLDTAHSMLFRQVSLSIGIVAIYVSPIIAFLEDRISWDEYLFTIAELSTAGI